MASEVPSVLKSQIVPLLLTTYKYRHPLSRANAIYIKLNCEFGACDTFMV